MEDKERIIKLENLLMVKKLTVVKVYQDFKISQEETKALRKDWERSRDIYEEADLELAQLDGRLTVISGPSPRQKEAKVIEPITLTLDQVKALAKRLGIKLDKEVTENV